MKKCKIIILAFISVLALSVLFIVGCDNTDDDITETEQTSAETEEESEETEETEAESETDSTKNEVASYTFSEQKFLQDPNATGSFSLTVPTAWTLGGTIVFYEDNSPSPSHSNAWTRLGVGVRPETKEEWENGWIIESGYDWDGPHIGTTEQEYEYTYYFYSPADDQNLRIYEFFITPKIGRSYILSFQSRLDADSDDYLDTVIMPIVNSVVITGEPETEVVLIDYEFEEFLYERELVDILDYGLESEYSHSICYPIITSPQSENITALNKKIAVSQKDMLDMLQSYTEANLIFNTTYSISQYDGILFIRIIKHTGAQYSEGGLGCDYYYFDLAADRELTLDEYLARFGLDRARAEELSLASSSVVSTSVGYYDEETIITDGIFGDRIDEYNTNTVYYSKKQKLNPGEEDFITLDGAEVNDGIMRLYFKVKAYTVGINTCEIDLAAMLPADPYYVAFAEPTEITEGGNLRLTVKDGKVTEFKVPKEIGEVRIKLSSSGFIIYTSYHFNNHTLMINGEELSRGNYASAGVEQSAYNANAVSADGSAWLSEADGLEFTYGFSTGYIPLGDNTFEMVPRVEEP